MNSLPRSATHRNRSRAEAHMKLADKVLVVTGAGSGIARAVTLEAVRRGARVAAVDLNTATAGGGHNPCRGRRRGFDPCPEYHGPDGRGGSARAGDCAAGSRRWARALRRDHSAIREVAGPRVRRHRAGLRRQLVGDAVPEQDVPAGAARATRGAHRQRSEHGRGSCPFRARRSTAPRRPRSSC